MGQLQSRGRSRKKRGRPLLGGPADGATTSRGEIFVYANSHPKISPSPFPHAELYKRDGEAFRWVERELGRCCGCGSYVKRPLATCPLCGGKVDDAGPADRGSAV